MCDEILQADLMKRQAFTLIELVMILLIIGIVSVFSIQKLSLFSGLESTQTADLLPTILTQSQKTAVSSRRTVYVVITASQIRACFDASCSQPISGINGAQLQLTNQTGFSFSPTGTFTYNSMGQSSNTAPLNVSYGARTYTIEAYTGFISGGGS